MHQLRSTALLFASLVVAPAVSAAHADELSNHAFRIQYDASGIRSLKRTNDIHDTDYIAANGALGRLLIRYRTTPNGDWRELRDLLMRPQTGQRESIEYALGTLLPTLASKASPSAERGVGGLRGLNDGLVPIAPDAGGRGAGSGGPPGRLRADTATASASQAQVPMFTWTAGANEPGAGGTGAAGPTRWVQYTFPIEEEVSRTEVFWVNPPQKWRLLYADGRAWKEVAPSGPYGIAADAFTTVEFTPVKTMALRVEVTMPQTGGVSLAEWRVGPEPKLVPSTDLTVNQTFRLDGEVLDWTITLANDDTRPAELADLAVPLNFAERAGARGEIYTKKLIRHALVAGHGSWVYWQRSKARDRTS